MSILAVCVQLDTRSNYGFLNQQDWDKCELILGGTQAKINHFLTEFRSTSAYYCFPIKSVVNTQPNSLIDSVESEYFLFLNPHESWQPEFLQQAKLFLEGVSLANYQQVLYSLGFVDEQMAKSQSKTTFALDFAPLLKYPNRVYKNIFKPNYLSPLVKYFFQTSIVREFKLRLDPELEIWSLAQAIFGLDYLATMFSLNNYTEPEFKSTVMSFKIGDPQTELSPRWLDLYHQKVEAKQEIWQKNIWSKVYWVFTWKKFLCNIQRIMEGSKKTGDSNQKPSN
jgi:hypothetical protein